MVSKAHVFPGSHTGLAIAKEFQLIIDKYEIPLSKILSVVRDGGANVKCAFKILYHSDPLGDDGTYSEGEDDLEISDSDEDAEQIAKIQSSSTCVAHSLHLAVLEGVKQAKLMKMLKRARLIVRVFRLSPLQNAKISANLVIDCITR